MSRFARSCENYDFSCAYEKSQKSQGQRFFAFTCDFSQFFVSLIRTYIQSGQPCACYNICELKLRTIARPTIFCVHLPIFAVLCLVNNIYPKWDCGFYKICEKSQVRVHLRGFAQCQLRFFSFVLLISSDTTGSINIRRNNEVSGTHIPRPL